MLAGHASVIPLAIIVFIDAHDADSALPGALSRAAERALGAHVAIATRALEVDAEGAGIVDRARAAGAKVAARVTWTDPERLAARLQVFEVDTGRVSTRTVVFEASDAPAERGRSLGLLLASVLDTEASSGAGSGVGGTAGLRWARWRRLSLRVGARARFGEVVEAQASSSAYAFGAGAVVGIVEPEAGGRLALGMRASALLLYESLTHLSDDDTAPVQQGRFLPGASALAELTWSLSPSVALLLAAGGEVAFGRTEVYVRSQAVADLAALRLLAQGGLLARF